MCSWVVRKVVKVKDQCRVVNRDLSASDADLSVESMLDILYKIYRFRKVFLDILKDMESV